MAETPGFVDDLELLVGQIRTGAYAEASSRLNHCILAIQQQLSNPPQRDPQALQKILDAIRRMLGHLEKQDWVAFADVVEFELVPLFRTPNI